MASEALFPSRERHVRGKQFNIYNLDNAYDIDTRFIFPIELTKNFLYRFIKDECYGSIVSRDALHEKWCEVGRKMADQNYERVDSPSRGYRFPFPRRTTLLLISSFTEVNET